MWFQLFVVAILCSVGSDALPPHLECKTTDVGHEYAGTMSTTVNGNACRPWSMGSNYAAAQDPANFPDGSIDAASNYCRNPDSDPGGPWCHVAHSNIGHWEYCPVPLCSECKNSLVQWACDHYERMHYCEASFEFSGYVQAKCPLSCELCTGTY